MSTVPMYGAVMTLAKSREITIAANKYIDDHPKVIALATDGILLREAY